MPLRAEPIFPEPSLPRGMRRPRARAGRRRLRFRRSPRAAARHSPTGARRAGRDRASSGRRRATGLPVRAGRSPGLAVRPEPRPDRHPGRGAGGRRRVGRLIAAGEPVRFSYRLPEGKQFVCETGGADPTVVARLLLSAEAEAAPAPAPAPPRPASVSRSSAGGSIDELLLRMYEMKASDLHLSAGEVPMVRLHGEIVRLDDLGVFPAERHGVRSSARSCRRATRSSSRRRTTPTSPTRSPASRASAATSSPTGRAWARSSG